MTFFSTTEEVDEVLALSAVKNYQQVIQPLEKALDFLQREAPARYLVPLVPHVVMSEATVLGLFEALWRLDDRRAPDVARKIGETAGLRFAELFWDWLVELDRTPAYEDPLLRVWTRIESSANWGLFEFSRRDREVVIHVTNSFLNRDSRFPHRYCDFMAGYVFGFLWISLKELHFRSRGQGADAAPATSSITESAPGRKCAGNRCAFELPLGADSLWQAVEEFLKARNFGRTHPDFIDQQIVPLRNSLEVALQTKFGLAESDRFDHALRAAKSVLTTGDWAAILNSAEDAYAALSRPLHRRREAGLDARQVRTLSQQVERFLREITYAPVGRDRAAQILTIVRQRESTRRSPEGPPQESAT